MGRHAHALFAAFAVILAASGPLAACVGDDPELSGGPSVDSGANPAADGAAADGAPATDASTTEASDGAQPTELPHAVNTSIVNPLSIAVSSNSIAILTATKIQRCPLTDCTVPADIADDITATSQPQPYMLDVDDNDVHWYSRNSGNLGPYYYKCPLAGCFGKSAALRYLGDGTLENPTSLSLGIDGLVRITQKFDVPACGATGCTPSGCVSADAIKSAVFDGTSLFWSHTTDPGGVYRCKPGVPGTVQLHATAGAVILADGATIYTMTATGISACAKTGCGGQPNAIVSSEAGISSMALGPQGVYWSTSGSTTNADGAIKMCPLTGCGGSIRIVASAQAQPTSLRYRAGKIYWANRGAASGVGSAIMRSSE